jgi:hypothetical protein
MHRFCRIVIVAALVVLMASPAFSQGRRPRGGRGGIMSGAMLLGQKSVQEELKLSDDQVKEWKEFGEKMRKEREGLRDLSREEAGKKMQELRKESEEKLAKLLDKKQAKRLKQITLQVSKRFMGAGVYANPEVAKALAFTDDQKKDIKAIQEDAGKQIREIFQGEGTREEKGQKMAELGKETTAKIEKLLTDDQKSKWKELVGPEFKGKLEFRGGGRGRRPRN